MSGENTFPDARDEAIVGLMMERSRLRAEVARLQQWIDGCRTECPHHSTSALLAEVEMLREALRREREPSCVVCDATLDMTREGPPHCSDCVPTDDHVEEWERAFAALEEMKP